MNFKASFALMLLIVSATGISSVIPARSFHTPCSTDDGQYEEFGPRASQLLIKIYPDYASELESLKNKEIDIMDWMLEPADYQWFETNDPNHEQYSTAFYTEFSLSELDMNCQVLPTSIISVRQAFAHMLDKQYFIDNYLPYSWPTEGFGSKADSVLASLPGWYNPSCTDKYNLQPRHVMDPIPDDSADWEAAYDLLVSDLGEPILDPEDPAYYTWTWPSPFSNPDPTGTFPPVADGHLLVYARGELVSKTKEGYYFEDCVETYMPLVLPTLGKPPARLHVDLYVIPRSFVYPQVRGYYRYHLYTGGWTLGRDPDFLLYYTTGEIIKPEEYGNNYVCYSNSLFDNEVNLMLEAPNTGNPTTPCDAVYHAWQAQEIMENDEPTIPIYAFAGYKAYLSNWRSIVNEAGSGAGSWWTFLDAHKVGSEGGDVIRYGWASDLLSLNVISASSYWDWMVLDKIYEPLIKDNPFNVAEDRPWIADSWETSTWTNEGWAATKITFSIREDVWWQDVPAKPDRTWPETRAGFTNMHLTPVDVAFSTEYLRDNTDYMLCPILQWNVAHVKINPAWTPMWPWTTPGNAPPWWDFPAEDWQYDFVQFDSSLGLYDVDFYFNYYSQWRGLHEVAGALYLIPMHVWMWIRIGTSGDVDAWAEDIVYGCGPWILLDRTPGVSMTMIPFRNGQSYKGVILERSYFALPVRPAQGTVGITGYKLVFKETLTNLASIPLLIDYYWIYDIKKWNGTAWSTFDFGNSPAFARLTISPSETINLYWTFLLPFTCEWGDWLKLGTSFYWVISSAGLWENVVGVKQEGPVKLHVHPGDISSSAAVVFPYLGADGIVSIHDVALIGVNWGKSVPPGTDPTSSVTRADVNGNGVVSIQDAAIVGACWQKGWSNSPPPS